MGHTLFLPSAPFDVHETPYLMATRLEIERRYNPLYGDDRICECNHPYYRHFDSYEDNEAVGCKYCGCYIFYPLIGPPTPGEIWNENFLANLQEEAKFWASVDKITGGW